MTRFSKDHFDSEGNLIDGFDYQLQCWVMKGVVINCGHRNDDCGCNARKYAGQKIVDVRARISTEHLKKFFSQGREVRDGNW